MLKNIKRDNQGFTIIETLIVLAIAAVIILIVLLAVPALQRSSRNTNIKNDASAIASAITEYESNNNGGLPALTTSPTTTSSTGVYVIGTSSNGGITSNAKLQTGDVVYDASDAGAIPTTGTAPTTPTAATIGDIAIVYEDSCPNGGVTPSARSTAIFYPIQSSSGVSWGCIDD